jgi:predicted ATP-dependent endonuclease of OLD family
MEARLEIEGIRCFATKQSGILRPLTLLIGENSSGKTTFLAVRQIAASIANIKLELSFNDPPFRLGAYEQIA